MVPRIRSASLIALVLVLLSATPPAAQSAGVADTLLDVRFGDHGTYERAVLDLGSARTPADFVPYYRWARINGSTVLRVRLPTVDSTRKTDGKGLGVGISRYYVVRASDRGSLFVDLHLTDSAGPVNVFYLNHPARIVVDVPETGGDSPHPGAAFGESAVIMKPRKGSTVGPEAFSVTGYGRPFEARGTWRVKNAAGKVVRDGSYETSDWSGTWGRFAFTTSYPASLEGREGVLEVGEQSARDGKFRGVSVPLRFR